VQEQKTLQDYFEDYLKSEGLSNVIPEYRRPSLFSLPSSSIVLVWLAGLWLLEIYIVLQRRGLGGLLIAILGPAVLFLGALLVISVAFASRQLRGDKAFGSKDPRLVGGIMLFGFPLLVAVLVGFYLMSWEAAGRYVGFAILVIVFLVILQAQAYRTHLLIELARSAFRVLGQSITLLFVLVPLLLVIVGLSIFSQGLWQAVGNLTVLQFVGSTFLITLPAILLMLVSLKKMTMEIVGSFPGLEKIIENVENIPFLKSKIEKGLVSNEEWMKVRDELSWRDKSKLAEGLLPALQARAKRWLAMLLGLTSFILVIVFFLYFCALFNMLLPPSLVATWVGIQVKAISVQLPLFGHRWEMPLLSTVIPIAKGSLFLSVFLSVLSIVYTFTDAPSQERATEWLRTKVASWLAASSVYQSIMSPNYQIWEYVVHDKRRGVANVFIVVPKGISEEEAKKACEHMESCLDEFRSFVMITAYEQNVERPIYRYDIPGNRWRLLHNKNTKVRTFDAFPLSLDELRYQHFLGRDCSWDEAKIPDDWFGNTSQGVAVAKSIWKADTGHDLVLHPYVHVLGEQNLSIDVNFAKRMTNSDQYRQYIRKLLVLISEKIPNVKSIWIGLCFRDTVEVLAHLAWNEQLPDQVVYSDEVIGKTRFEAAKAWNIGSK